MYCATRNERIHEIRVIFEFCYIRNDEMETDSYLATAFQQVNYQAGAQVVFQQHIGIIDRQDDVRCCLFTSMVAFFQSIVYYLAYKS